MAQAKTNNIYQRMNAVMRDVHGVGKDKKAQFAGGFNYASHDAVVRAVRESFVEHGIVMVMDLKSQTVDGNRLEAVYTVRFVNIDSPEDFIETDWFGFGIDSSDKGPGKAISYIKKYAILNTLSLPTGDDPENGNDAHKPSAANRSKSRKAAMPKEKPSPATVLGVSESEKFEGVWSVKLKNAEGKEIDVLTQSKETSEQAREHFSAETPVFVSFTKTDAGNFKLDSIEAAS
tara:strand:+ start:79 stop:774 length:696 start_codon:yes stop_codon:yes gene_type:complete